MSVNPVIAVLGWPHQAILWPCLRVSPQIPEAGGSLELLQALLELEDWGLPSQGRWHGGQPASPATRCLPGLLISILQSDSQIIK